MNEEQIKTLFLQAYKDLKESSKTGNREGVADALDRFKILSELSKSMEHKFKFMYTGDPTMTVTQFYSSLPPVTATVGSTQYWNQVNQVATAANQLQDLQHIESTNATKSSATWDYSEGEDKNSRPPSWLDWNDDGKVDTPNQVKSWGSAGNSEVADWIANPQNWEYDGPNTGWTKKQQPAPVYVRPAPPPPPRPPAGPDMTQPTFNFQKQKDVIRYEYVYGIKDLQIHAKQYLNKSIFVTKQISVDGNIIQVALDASENHPDFDEMTGQASPRLTSIEYYITYSENPSIDEWIPILPEDQIDIKCELLMFDAGHTATLRFPASPDGTSVVYQNGITMDAKDWAFSAGATRIQLIATYDPDSVYTIDYTPNSELQNPWSIDIHGLVARRTKVTDVFTSGTNHNKTVVLSKYPYVDKEMVNLSSSYNPNTDSYRPVQVTLKDADLAGPNNTTLSMVSPYDGTSAQVAYTYNITDYKSGATETPAPYSTVKASPQPSFQYYQDGNKLYFSETFNRADLTENQDTNHGNATIQVDYEALVTSVRMKIIMRRNAQELPSVTPTLNDFSLKFKVMK